MTLFFQSFYILCILFAGAGSVYQQTTAHYGQNSKGHQEPLSKTVLHKLHIGIEEIDNHKGQNHDRNNDNQVRQ